MEHTVPVNRSNRPGGDITQAIPTMTQERLDAIEARAKAASDASGIGSHNPQTNRYPVSSKTGPLAGFSAHGDAMFYLHARSDVLDLLADNRRLRSELEEAIRALGEVRRSEAVLSGLLSDEGVVAIAIERQRHKDVWHWTAKHDDTHTRGELAGAAAAYAMAATEPGWWKSAKRCENRVPATWPMSWSIDWWKPTDSMRMLEKAGSLIAAEISRRRRLTNNNFADVDKAVADAIADPVIRETRTATPEIIAEEEAHV